MKIIQKLIECSESENSLLFQKSIPDEIRFWRHLNTTLSSTIILAIKFFFKVSLAVDKKSDKKFDSTDSILHLIPATGKMDTWKYLYFVSSTTMNLYVKFPVTETSRNGKYLNAIPLNSYIHLKLVKIQLKRKTKCAEMI